MQQISPEMLETIRSKFAQIDQCPEQASGFSLKMPVER